MNTFQELNKQICSRVKFTGLNLCTSVSSNSILLKCSVNISHLNAQIEFIDNSWVFNNKYFVEREDLLKYLEDYVLEWFCAVERIGK